MAAAGKAKAKASPKAGNNSGAAAVVAPAVPVVSMMGSAGKPVPGCAVVPDIGWIVDSGSGYDIVCNSAVSGKDRKV